MPKGWSSNDATVRGAFDSMASCASTMTKSTKVTGFVESFFRPGVVKGFLVKFGKIPLKENNTKKT